MKGEGEKGEGERGDGVEGDGGGRKRVGGQENW